MLMSNTNDAFRPVEERCPGSSPRSARILVSDRDVLSREVLFRRLQAQGYVCESCECRQGVLELLGNSAFDLLLIVVDNPGTESLDFVKKVKQRDPDVAIILVTPLADIESAVDALKQGVYDHITKPYRPEEISLSVSRALEKRRLLMENNRYRRTLEQQVSLRTRQLKEALGILRQTYHSTLVALSKALDTRDADPDGHTLRITAYAARLARQVGMPEPEIRSLEQGILLHDIGNIGIPDAVLMHKDSLGENDRILMLRHPEIGFRILSRIKFLKEPAQLVLQHHERYDGQGYPFGLKGGEISPGARIYAVADAFDSLFFPHSSCRVSDYEKARERITAMAGAELDPSIVESFLEVPFEEWIEIGRSIDNGRCVPEVSGKSSAS